MFHVFMFHASSDTIVAISSAVAPAPRMIVRMTGPDSHGVAAQLSAYAEFAPSAAVRTILRFAGLQAPAWVYRFTAPHSYTTQDLVEFHIPGNPLLARMLLDALIAQGARRAEPGEFTARAYF